MPSELQARLFDEFTRKDALDAAREHSLAFVDEALGRRAYPSAAGIEGLAGFDGPLAEQGTDAREIIEQLSRHGAPGVVSSLGGRYFGLVVGGVLPAAMAARWVADAWNQNTALYRLSPVGSKLETICERWLKTLFKLPGDTVAGFVSGSSVAILAGLAAGRERIFRNRGWDINAKGLRGAPPIRVVAGRHAHSTIVKGIAILGLGVDNVEWVDVDEQGRILADKVPPLDDSTILILQAGNVNSGSFDPFDSLCGRANAAGSWVHIDGAFGLWAAASAKLSHLAAGIERAHSWSVDGHKTLNTPLDCGILLCRDRDALVTALQMSGSYIVYSEERDGMIYTPEMSRRARAVELWAALKSLGRRGVEQLVDQLHERASQIAAELEGFGFELLNDVVFNQVLVGCGDDALTDATIEQIQNSGECWVGGTQWGDRRAIRISVCSWATTPADIERSARAFRDARQRAEAASAQLNH
ncbi:MAG: pyridoxal phosphate-dependent decarboxylase family protein [Sphingomonas sp.]